MTQLNLVIGPQKTATTFLHHIITQSSTLHAPKLKELNYLLTLTSWAGDYDTWKYRDLLRVKSQIAQRSFDLRHFTNPHEKLLDLQLAQYDLTMNGYKKLFDTPFPGFDVSPSYSAISEADWEVIRKEFDVRIIMIMRSPVERMWSALNMYQRQLSTKLKIDGISNIRDVQNLLSNLSDFSRAVICVKYAELTPMLMQNFGKNFHVLNFKEVITTPRISISRIRKWTGLTIPDALEKNYHGMFHPLWNSVNTDPQNSSPKSVIPDWFNEWYACEYPEEVGFVENHMNNFEALT